MSCVNKSSATDNDEFLMLLDSKKRGTQRNLVSMCKTYDALLEEMNSYYTSVIEDIASLEVYKSELEIFACSPIRAHILYLAENILNSNYNGVLDIAFTRRRYNQLLAGIIRMFVENRLLLECVTDNNYRLRLYKDLCVRYLNVY